MPHLPKNVLHATYCAPTSVCVSHGEWGVPGTPCLQNLESQWKFWSPACAQPLKSNNKTWSSTCRKEGSQTTIKLNHSFISITASLSPLLSISGNRGSLRDESFRNRFAIIRRTVYTDAHELIKTKSSKPVSVFWLGEILGWEAPFTTVRIQGYHQ